MRRSRVNFAQRLRGFGLNPRTIHKDFVAAVVNLLSVWLLVMVMIVITGVVVVPLFEEMLFRGLFQF